MKQFVDDDNDVVTVSADDDRAPGDGDESGWSSDLVFFGGGG